MKQKLAPKIRVWSQFVDWFLAYISHRPWNTPKLVSQSKVTGQYVLLMSIHHTNHQHAW